MSNKNDMKFIMEGWRRTINELTPELIDDPEVASKIAQDIGKSNNAEKLAEILPASKAAWDKFFEWYDKQDASIRFIIDIFVPLAGQAVDIREALAAYSTYEEWYLLDDDDPTKHGQGAINRFGGTGPELLAGAMIAALLAIPGFDLIEGLKYGKKLIPKYGGLVRAMRTLFPILVEGTGALSLLSYEALKYAEKGPDYLTDKDPETGLPADFDQYPEEYLNTWEARRQRQYRRLRDEAAEALEKYEKYMEQRQALEKDRESRFKAGRTYDDVSRGNKLDTMLENWNNFIVEAKSDNDVNMVSKVLIIDDKDRFLALLRPTDSKYMPNRWDFPGGHLKDGESHKQAAKREVKEETGLTVKGLEEIGEDDKRMHVVFYRSTNYSGDIKLDKEENQEFKWIKLSEVDNYDTVPTVSKFVKQELNGRE